MVDFGPEERAEYLRLFCEEAEEQLRAIGEGLLALRRDPGRLEWAREPHRAAHTLKGSAGYLGLEGIGALARAVERTLKGIAEGRTSLTPEREAALVEALELLYRLVRQVARGGTDEDLRVATLVARLEGLAESP
ncbi:MAG: Hpt domain-containing protein [Anaerolineae bacterium]